MERAGAGLKRSITSLRSALSEKDGCVSVATAREAFRDFKLKLEQLDLEKREAVRKQRQFIKNMQSRIQFLRNEDISSEKAQRDLEMWRRDRQQVARLICTQMLRCGHVESAKALANEMEISNIVDLEVFAKVERVINALLSKDTTPCLEWIGEHRSKLRRMNSKLEQVVRVQNAVELVRDGRVKEALMYIRKHLGASKDGWCEDAMKVMGLIALRSHNDIPAYKELLSDQRWQRLADLFREEVFALYQVSTSNRVYLEGNLYLEPVPHLISGYCSSHVSLPSPCAYNVASVLTKLRTAHQEEWRDAQLASHAPMHWLKDFHMLIPSTPGYYWNFSFHLKLYPENPILRLICSYSGEALNEENHPMMMPDGRVYGEKAIRELQVSIYIERLGTFLIFSSSFLTFLNSDWSNFPKKAPTHTITSKS
ncbi:hypothetical protein ANCDUO_14546 [Ancylostoma duodenale]|uniref:E3 ubiquitin-protein transferase MAEA n=1 Tax=Ancylostoma duodenale TaxID=51022 RepID=A0A0C2G2X6_9BILA|nr:hypothetical protein ANCDUO_14546 [Ancylostoma duodenale]